MEYDDTRNPDDFAVLADFVEDVDQESEDLTESAWPQDNSVPAEAHQAPTVTPITSADFVRLADDFSELRAKVEKGFGLLERQSDLVDRLHGENERLRRGEFDRMLDPLVRDLVALADSCLRNADAWLARPATTPADTHRVLSDVASDISLVLERQGVETFSPEPGAPFDRKQQRAARTEPTQEAEMNGRIARTIRPGYRSGTRTVRFADVVVLNYSPGAPESPEPEPESTSSIDPTAPDHSNP